MRRQDRAIAHGLQKICDKRLQIIAFQIFAQLFQDKVAGSLDDFIRRLCYCLIGIRLQNIAFEIFIQSLKILICIVFHLKKAQCRANFMQSALGKGCTRQMFEPLYFSAIRIQCCGSLIEIGTFHDPNIDLTVNFGWEHHIVSFLYLVDKSVQHSSTCGNRTFFSVRIGRNIFFFVGITRCTYDRQVAHLFPADCN